MYRIEFVNLFRVGCKVRFKVRYRFDIDIIKIFKNNFRLVMWNWIVHA